jgi:predicted Zn-dependent protease
MATEDESQLAEAEQVLKAAVGRDRENPSRGISCGVVYGARGDIPRAQLASAEQQIMSGLPREALHNAESAERGLPSGSPDWIRARTWRCRPAPSLNERATATRPDSMRWFSPWLIALAAGFAGSRCGT